MKPKFVVLLFAAVLVLSGCDDDETLPQEPTINGTWHLKNVSGGFAGVDEDFSRGEVIWTFDEESSVLTVENNSKETFIGLASGVYSYSVSEVEGDEVLFIDEGEFGILTIAKTEMAIDQGLASDGFLFNFQR
jgi:hypothetical protein